MKFPLKVINHDNEECEISIAAINGHVSRLSRGSRMSKISSQIRVRNLETCHKHDLEWDQIYDLAKHPLGDKLKAEIEKRARVRRASAIGLGSSTLKPLVCLRVTLQVIIKNGLPLEDPKSNPKFRVQLRYWDGSVHTLWSDFNPDNDSNHFRVKTKGKWVELHFANHDDVLTAIRELMP